MCPLLLPFNGSSDGSYSQPVAVQRNLIVLGKNLPVSILLAFDNLALSMSAHILLLPIMLVFSNLSLLDLLNAVSWLAEG